MVTDIREGNGEVGMQKILSGSTLEFLALSTPPHSYLYSFFQLALTSKDTTDSQQTNHH